MKLKKLWTTLAVLLPVIAISTCAISMKAERDRNALAMARAHARFVSGLCPHCGWFLRRCRYDESSSWWQCSRYGKGCGWEALVPDSACPADMVQVPLETPDVRGAPPVAGETRRSRFMGALNRGFVAQPLTP